MTKYNTIRHIRFYSLMHAYALEWSTDFADQSELSDTTRPLSRRRSPKSPPKICPPKIRRRNYGALNQTLNVAHRKSAVNTFRRRFFAFLSLFAIMRYLFFVFSHSPPTNFYCVVVQFFDKGLICMCKNVKLLCCAAYILVVSICLSC